GIVSAQHRRPHPRDERRPFALDGANVITPEPLATLFDLRPFFRRELALERGHALDRANQLVGRRDRSGLEVRVERLEQPDEAFLLADLLAQSLDVQLDHSMGRELRRVETGANLVEAEP